MVFPAPPMVATTSAAAIRTRFASLAHEVGDGGGDLVGAVLLDEMHATDGGLGQVGQDRMSSRMRPWAMAPGSALMNSLGTFLSANQLL